MGYDKSLRGGNGMVLTEEERRFAEENHHIVGEYLKKRKLPEDDWYDVVIFRYLRAVKLWFLRAELHKWSFRTIAYNNMRSAIGHEREKQGKRIPTVSIYEEIPGTDGLTIADTVTADNLNYIFPLGRSDNGMELRYNVKLPPKREFSGGRKSDERIAIDAFLVSEHKNMCFEYETTEQAKKKLNSINSSRRANKETEAYDAYRVDKCVYIVRLPKKGGAKK